MRCGRSNGHLLASSLRTRPTLRRAHYAILPLSNGRSKRCAVQVLWAAGEEPGASTKNWKRRLIISGGVAHLASSKRQPRAGRGGLPACRPGRGPGEYSGAAM